MENFYKFSIENSNNIVIFNKNNRRINVILTNLQLKKDKINFALKVLNNPLIAILDADHRPTANWLSSSVNILFSNSEIKSKNNNKEVVAVQTRRKPLLINHLAQVWDSGQNHLGNELLNNFLTKIFSTKGSVFLLVRQHFLRGKFLKNLIYQIQLRKTLVFLTIYGVKAILFCIITKPFRMRKCRRLL